MLVNVRWITVSHQKFVLSVGLVYNYTGGIAQNVDAIRTRKWPLCATFSVKYPGNGIQWGLLKGTSYGGNPHAIWSSTWISNDPFGTSKSILKTQKHECSRTNMYHWKGFVKQFEYVTTKIKIVILRIKTSGWKKCCKDSVKHLDFWKWKIAGIIW